MDESEASAGFIAKWRARWPEWPIAEVFIPPSERGIAVAWFALLQELTDAAWAGVDPAPGLAKLAWWQEELRGWARGARRHPLGAVLQRQPAPWDALADGLSALRHRDALLADVAGARDAIAPFAAGVARVEAVLFTGLPPDEAALAAGLLGDGTTRGGSRENARVLLAAWPAMQGQARARRLWDALTRARLHGFSRDGLAAPVPGWRALWLCWRAACN